MIPTGYIITVENLPPSMTTDRLKDLFVPFGNVRWARLMGGSGPVLGHVELDTVEAAISAQQALNKAVIDGYALKVLL